MGRLLDPKMGNPFPMDTIQRPRTY